MAHLVAAALADELDVDDELVRVGGARIDVAKLPSAIDFVHHAELRTGSPGRHRDRDLAHLDQLGLARSGGIFAPVPARPVKTISDVTSAIVRRFDGCRTSSVS